MDPGKRETILREIEYWRRAKMLPEHYCDFLRNLYVEQHDEVGSGQERSARRLSWRLLSRIMGVLLIISLLFLYFTTYHPLLQMAISIWLVGTLIGIGYAWQTKRPLVATAALGSGSLLALLLGLFVLYLHEHDQAGWIVLLVAVCGVLWAIIGITARNPLLHVAGWIALALAYVWVIGTWHASPNWLILQLYAVPVAIVLFVLGRRWLNGIRSPGAALLPAAVLYLVLPELYSLLMAQSASGAVIAVLVGKTALAGLIMLAVRKSLNQQKTELANDHDATGKSASL